MCRQIKEKEMGGEGALCGGECGWKEKVKEEGGLCFGDDKKSPCQIRELMCLAYWDWGALCRM